VASTILVDASFLIALERETASRTVGPARNFLPKLRGHLLVVSVVTIEEVLEGAKDHDQAMEYLGRFVVQPIHIAHARRCALTQQRSGKRMGENDAWLVATAEVLDAAIVAKDRGAFERLGKRYLRFDAA
jgi:predicted nucleic acid-binding protein